MKWISKLTAGIIILGILLLTGVGIYAAHHFGDLFGLRRMAVQGQRLESMGETITRLEATRDDLAGYNSELTGQIADLERINRDLVDREREAAAIARRRESALAERAESLGREVEALRRAGAEALGVGSDAGAAADLVGAIWRDIESLEAAVSGAANEDIPPHPVGNP